MNDIELDRILDTIHRDRASIAEPPRLRQAALADLHHPSHRGASLQRRGSGVFTLLSGPPMYALTGLATLLLVGLMLASIVARLPDDGSTSATVTTASFPPKATAAAPASAEADQPALARGPITTRTDVLAGVPLQAQEFEDGIVRVASDGVRELAIDRLVSCQSLRAQQESVLRSAAGLDSWESEPFDERMSAGKVVAGHDDGIWLFWHDRFVKLGEERAYRWTAGQVPDLGDDIEVGRDGAIWHAPVSGRGLPRPAKPRSEGRCRGKYRRWTVGDRGARPQEPRGVRTRVARRDHPVDQVHARGLREST